MPEFHGYWPHMAYQERSRFFSVSFNSPTVCENGISSCIACLGRIYVGCALISAPLAVAVAASLPTSSLLMASGVHSAAWILTTATGLYCARTGRIQQHREWMIRSYPLAMVFVVARAIRKNSCHRTHGFAGS